MSVYDKSCGIGGVTYSAEKDEYYALTRFPDRYILVFDGATHIESLDIVGDKLYASFINYIGSSSQMSQVYVLPILTESINMKK